MRGDEVYTKTIKDITPLVLIGYNTGESKLHHVEQITFFFVDIKGRVWTHHQVMRYKSVEAKVAGSKFLSHMGLNLSKHGFDPFKLYVDLCSKDWKESDLYSLIGRVYFGKLVYRVLKSKEHFGDNKKHIFFDLDDVMNTRDFNQDKMIEKFKRESIVKDFETGPTSIYDLCIGNTEVNRSQLTDVDVTERFKLDNIKSYDPIAFLESIKQGGF